MKTECKSRQSKWTGTVFLIRMDCTSFCVSSNSFIERDCIINLFATKIEYSVVSVRVCDKTTLAVDAFVKYLQQHIFVFLSAILILKGPCEDHVIDFTSVLIAPV